MTEVPIADAGQALPHLVQRVEAGEAVYITRDGRPVAVLVSEAECGRWLARRERFSDFLERWRAKAAAEGGFAENGEFEGVRDHGAGRDVTFE